jgi:hypothetical protein
MRLILNKRTKSSSPKEENTRRSRDARDALLDKAKRILMPHQTQGNGYQNKINILTDPSMLIEKSSYRITD